MMKRRYEIDSQAWREIARTTQRYEEKRRRGNRKKWKKDSPLYLELRRRPVLTLCAMWSTSWEGKNHSRANRNAIPYPFISFFFSSAFIFFDGEKKERRAVFASLKQRLWSKKKERKKESKEKSLWTELTRNNVKEPGVHTPQCLV